MVHTFVNLLGCYQHYQKLGNLTLPFNQLLFYQYLTLQFNSDCKNKSSIVWFLEEWVRHLRNIKIFKFEKVFYHILSERGCSNAKAINKTIMFQN